MQKLNTLEVCTVSGGVQSHQHGCYRPYNCSYVVDSTINFGALGFFIGCLTRTPINSSLIGMGFGFITSSAQVLAEKLDKRYFPETLGNSNLQTVSN